MSLRILTCFFFLSLTVLAHGQNVKLPNDEITLQQAFREITNQTGYNFGYSSSSLDVSKKISISKAEAPLDEILTQLLAGTDFGYLKKGRYILISHKQERPTAPVIESSKTLVFNFRFSKSLLERDYLNNTQRLDELHEMLSGPDAASRIIRIEITGTSSPDGATLSNERIAKERAAAVKDYIMWKYPHLERQKIFTYSAGEDWDGLLSLVEADPNMPSKSEVISILRLPGSSDYKKAQLKKLSNGKTSDYIIQNMSRYLRTGASCIILSVTPETEAPYDEPNGDSDFYAGTTSACDDPEPEIIDSEPIVEAEISTGEPEPEPELEHEPVTIDRCGLKWALKTNLLYDLTLTSSLSAEFYLGHRWSIGVEGIYSWWKFGNQFFNRVQAGGVEARRWFGSKSAAPFNGYYAGVYAMAGTYDIMLGGNTGALSDFSYSAGITFGYSMPIAKRLNLEMGVGVGYFGGKYKKYTYSADDGGCYPWQGTFERRYIGPTKANVSLVWLMGAGNKNTNKR